MEWNQETLQFLSQCFLHTLSPPPPRSSPPSPTPGPSAPATRYRPPSYAELRSPPQPSVVEQALCRRAARPSPSTSRTTSTPARPPCLTPHDTAATADAEASSAPIPDAEKEQIKALIILLMLSSSARIQTTHGAIPAGKESWLRFWQGGRNHDSGRGGRGRDSAEGVVATIPARGVAAMIPARGGCGRDFDRGGRDSGRGGN
ncbi:hypothetical protein NL676_022695 [Syzygium grande]|nr:hypothetical protein NL676_022695 [Syzygium grande]